MQPAKGAREAASGGPKLGRTMPADDHGATSLQVPATEAEAAFAAASPGSSWRSREVAALVVVAAGLLACFGWLLGAFDLESGLRAGQALLHGLSPYSPVTSPVFKAGHAFVYPYLVAWAFVPLAALPLPAAVGIFLFLSVGAIAAACHLLGRTGWLPTALVLSSSTTIVGLQMGTVNALLLLGVAVAWSQRDRWVLAGSAVAAAAVAKLFLIPLLAWLVLARRLRAAALAAGALCVALAAGWTLGPLGAHAYTAMLGDLQSREASNSWSLTSFFDSLGASPGQAELLAIAFAGAIVVAGAARARRTGDERNLFSASIIASLLATPIMWSSYLLVLAAVVLVVATDDRTVAALAAASWLVVTPDGASYPRVAVGMAVTGALAAVAQWHSRRDPRAQVSSGAWPLPLRLRMAAMGRHALAASRWLAHDRKVLTAASVVIVTAAILLLVPPAVRSALPSLLLMVAAAIEVARRTRSSDRAQAEGQ